MPRRGQRLHPVAQRWAMLFQEVDPSRLRRGRALARSGGVLRIRVENQVIEARVRSGSHSGHSYRVYIPCTVWWAPVADEIARWFVVRPDWFAAWLAGDWPEDLLETMEAGGFFLVPTEHMRRLWVSEMRCECPDVGHPCKHILAVLCRMAEEMEHDPPKVLEYAGIPRQVWLDKVHQQRLRWAKENAAVLPGGSEAVSKADAAVNEEPKGKAANDEAANGEAEPASSRAGETADADPADGWWPEERVALAALQPAGPLPGGLRVALDPSRLAPWQPAAQERGAEWHSSATGLRTGNRGEKEPG